MEITYLQLGILIRTLSEFADKEMPFKLSLIIAKDLNILNEEYEFYINKEREFAEKYLMRDQEGQFVKSADGAYKIIEGLENECLNARKDFDSFKLQLNLYKIPVSLLQNSNINFTPTQVNLLQPIIEEEEV